MRAQEALAPSQKADMTGLGIIVPCVVLDVNEALHAGQTACRAGVNQRPDVVDEDVLRTEAFHCASEWTDRAEAASGWGGKGYEAVTEAVESWPIGTKLIDRAFEREDVDGRRRIFVFEEIEHQGLNATGGHAVNNMYGRRAR